MKKCILSLVLTFCLCFSLIPVTAFAAEPSNGISGSYTDGVVTIIGWGFPAGTQYSMIAVKDGSDKLIALGSAKSDAAGAFNIEILTGAISEPASCKLYVYNDNGGTVVTSGTLSPEVEPVAQYTITAKAGSGGTIDPAGEVKVYAGAEKTFTIKANSGYAISDVKVDGTSVGKVSTYTFKDVSINHTIAASFTSTGSGGGSGSGGGGGSSVTRPTTPTTPTTPAVPTTPEHKSEPPVVAPNAPAKMTDTVGHWGKDAIDYAISRGLFAGTSETTFAPNAQMTRGMVWTVLARLDGQNTTGGDAWYSLAQTWAKRNDISDGSQPQGNVTREQLIVLLYRYSGQPNADRDLSGFTDASQINGWASDAMQWAVQNGLIVGSDNALNPQGNATRAEVASILMRYIKLTTI